MAFIRQNSFAVGQVDPVNWRRTELDSYLKAAQVLRNMEINIVATTRKRKGTQNLVDVTNAASEGARLYTLKDINGIFYLALFSLSVAYVYRLPDFTLIGAPIVIPYTNNDLKILDYSSNGDTIIFVHPNYPPQILRSVYGGPTSFSFGAYQYYPLPAFDFAKIDYSQFAVTFASNPSTATLTFTGLGSDPGFTNADWVGGSIVGFGTSADSPPGYGLITSVIPFAAGTVVFNLSVQSAFDTNPGNLGHQYVIRQPVYSATLGYPTSVVIYQNRLFFGGGKSTPNLLSGSRLGNFNNFDVGTGRDSDAIVVNIGLADSGEIINLNSGKQLEIYTQNFELVAPQDQNISLTPSNIRISLQSSFGSSELIKPLTYLNDSYYVSKTGKAIQNFKFNGVGLAYISTNVSLASQTLIKNPINRAIIRGSDISQDNFIYFLNYDNTLISFQFDTSFDLAAITTIDFGGDIEIIDLININNEIFFLKKNLNSNTFTIEKFTDSVYLDGWFIAPINGNLVQLPGNKYNGQTLGVTYFDGNSNKFYGEHQAVGDILQLSGSLPPSGATVTVGFLYDAQITTPYIYAGANFSEYKKHVSSAFITFYDTVEFYIDGELQNAPTFEQVQAGQEAIPRSGVARKDYAIAWEFDKSIIIKQREPYDLQVASISYFVEAQLT